MLAPKPKIKRVVLPGPHTALRPRANGDNAVDSSQPEIGVAKDSNAEDEFTFDTAVVSSNTNQVNHVAVDTSANDGNASGELAFKTMAESSDADGVNHVAADTPVINGSDTVLGEVSVQTADGAGGATRAARVKRPGPHRKFLTEMMSTATDAVMDARVEEQTTDASQDKTTDFDAKSNDGNTKSENVEGGWVTVQEVDHSAVVQAMDALVDKSGDKPDVVQSIDALVEGFAGGAVSPTSTNTTTKPFVVDEKDAASIEDNAYVDKDEDASPPASPVVIVNGGEMHDGDVFHDNLNPKASTWSPDVVNGKEIDSPISDADDGKLIDEVCPIPESWNIAHLSGDYAPGVLFDGPKIGEVYTAVLSHYSHYFATVFRQDSAAYDARLSRVLNDDAFPIFRSWIFGRSLVVRVDGVASHGSKIDLKTLINIWRFGALIQAPMFANAAADAIMSKRFDTDELLEVVSDVDAILTHIGPHHVFRDIVAHSIVVNGIILADDDPSEVHRWPKSILWTVLNWLAVGRARVGMDPLSRGHPCLYHLHTTDQNGLCPRYMLAAS